MTRFASSTNAAAVTQPHVPYVCFLELDFVSGTLYLSSADKQYNIGGQIYQPLGQFAQIGDLTESTDITGQTLTFTLSGVDSSIVNTTLGENYHNRQALLSVGYLDGNGNLVDTPELIWEGVMDVMTIRADANTSSITLDCENRLVLWNQASGWLFTQEHQRLIDSTDNFFDQVNSLASKSVIWGQANVATGTSPGPPQPTGPLLPNVPTIKPSLGY